MNMKLRAPIVLLIWLGLAAVLQAADTRPNILLIISDQHTSDAMGCAGDPYVKTPALDQLAANGVRFAKAYCTYPVCLPSRASIMSGMMPHALRSRTKPGKSLGTLMKEAGYQTAYFGKWHVAGVDIRKDQDWHGFDLAVDGRRDRETADESVNFIKARRDRPFFMVSSYLNPHDICEWARLRSGWTNQTTMHNGKVAIDTPMARCPPLPPNFAIPADEPEAVSLRRLSKPLAHPTEGWGETEWRQYRWAYARLIEKVDGMVGRLLTALEQTGQLENTLIVYVADHGDGNAGHHWNQKSVFYEEPVRVPFIVSWKGQTAAGKTDREHLVSMGLDLLPTFCDYAGVPTPKGLLGLSVRPFAQVKAGAQTSPTHRFVASEVYYDFPLEDRDGVVGRMIRSPRYKYIVYSAGKRPEQLFDLETDPYEMTNLAAQVSAGAVLNEHRGFLRDWMARTGDPYPEEPRRSRGKRPDAGNE